MGNFRKDSRSNFRGNRSGRDRFEGRSGGFGRRDRGSGGFERRRTEMFDVTCDKCGEECKVPFKPTGGKPVFCSNCFEKQGGSSGSFSSRERSAQSGMSSEQFSTINKKLDKIIEFLEQIEFEEDNEESGDEEEESDVEEEEDEDDEEESEEGLGNPELDK